MVSPELQMTLAITNGDENWNWKAPHQWASILGRIVANCKPAEDSN